MAGQLEREASRVGQLEAANAELKERLASMQGLGRSHQRLEEQLEEARRRAQEAGPADPGQAERYRREAEDRASLQIRQKLEEVNVFLQVVGGDGRMHPRKYTFTQRHTHTPMQQKIERQHCLITSPAFSWSWVW